ncbi:MAG: S41 family peptidase [Lachnospiraceae bacterium]|nr:S41 family peptidase [Clostridium sp.]MDY4821141.1 S41 family peptidase [Lachnospiraceae bacterium]
MQDNEIYTTGIEPGQQPENGGKKTQDKNGKFFWGGLFTGLIMSLLVVSSVYVVNRIQYAHKSGQTVGLHTREESQENTDGESVTGEAVNEDTVAKMKVIENVIDTYFYKEDVDKDAMVDGIFKGMVESLGDPYSEYYSKEELESLYQDSFGVYYGVGAYVSLDTATGLAKVSGIIADSPAEEADLRAEDIIYKVDDVDVTGMSLQETVSLIKGDENTTVKLTLIRDGKEIEKEVTRRKVESPTVKFEMLDDGMAYIQITEFDTVTVDQFTEAMAMARGNDMKGLILDLRSNPGGNLSSVVSIAKQMLPKGLIVYTEDRDGNREEYSCDGSKELDVPMVVLVNGNSASASEILAGAIKDYGIGTLVGTTTFGKGIVQRPIELSDGSAVKLTISSYYTPNGINIHGIGIEPDVECEFDSERYYSDKAYDNQLEKAKEVLLQKMEGTN